MADLKPGEVVKIHRPNKKEHGNVGRFITAEPDTAFGWVAFWKSVDARTGPPPPTHLHKQDLYPRRLFPLSQILPCELTS
jgi:hypothetical protein